MKTTAAVVHAQGGDFVLDEVDLDGPRDDEVLVRIVATGLCHTDLTMRGFLPPEMFPHVFGHEGAGVVEEVGADVTGVAVGDHVVLSFRSCRACARCSRGRGRLLRVDAAAQLHGHADGRVDDDVPRRLAGLRVASSGSPAWPGTRSRTPTTASWSTPRST